MVAWKNQKFILQILERIEGNAEGENRFAVLINKLVLSGKIEDIQRVSEDRVYREQLYIQYGIKRAEKNKK